MNTALETTATAASEPVEYVIVRTQSAGVFAGEQVEREGTEITLRNARRLWWWSGAASLSQLATTGTSDPAGCKFPAAVSKVILTEVIEIDTVSPEGRASIEAVPVWSA